MQYHPTKNFMNEWEYFSSKIVQIKEMNTVWQTDIEIFLFLLKEFAPKSGRLGVLERIRKLIVFNKVRQLFQVTDQLVMEKYHNTYAVRVPCDQILCDCVHDPFY